MATALRAPRRLATLPKRLARPSLKMRAPWEKFAASADALAPRALQGGADPTTLGEAWRWAKSYRFPEDVCGDYVGLVSGVAYGAHAIRGCDTGDARTDRRVRRLITCLSVASASLFGLVEILFCHRLQRVRGGFGSAHLFIEAFVIFASISFSRVAETVVRRIPAAKAVGGV
ncbi:hypothetical protein JL721_6348 [Aureococcus anophagefferens]|nr:hypothetical protein JL721_6348 [Aureococcus anophagefferens]